MPLEEAEVGQVGTWAGGPVVRPGRRLARRAGRFTVWLERSKTVRGDAEWLVEEPPIRRRGSSGVREMGDGRAIGGSEMGSVDRLGHGGGGRWRLR